jgi:hypothetical protein
MTTKSWAGIGRDQAQSKSFSPYFWEGFHRSHKAAAYSGNRPPGSEIEQAILRLGMSLKDLSPLKAGKLGDVLNESQQS